MDGIAASGFAPTVRSSTGTFTGPRGTADLEVTRSRNEDGSIGVERTITGQNGNTANFVGTVTRGEEGRQASGTLTTPAGREFEVNRTLTRTEDGFAFSGTVTGESGQSRSLELSIGAGEGGSPSVSGTLTRPDGSTQAITQASDLPRFGRGVTFDISV